MKRVAVIAIFMAIMASLFAFPVFADTPVQPLQVVTYSDTSTSVRISATAERLHYNVDSFQVVFMNPPNNYGTSCTPILVSFRFYNSNDLPAYVGQAEFELTATTGTGAVNTIIYGYDQISTDLFVAESSYSTAEVGRIGIGASNDFAYYTGFVIPPHTSLYFSCIVYVNASAYAQNNTGATEDVNQVTLSALNFYNNQISFSENYPYHNQPVDFSEIIQAISDLSDTVSTSSEMQSLIDNIKYTGNYYSSSISTGTVFSFDTTQDSIRTICRVYRGEPIYTNTDIYYNPVDDSEHMVGTVKVPISINVQVNVNSPVEVYYLQYINNVLPNYNTAFQIEYFMSDIYDSVLRSSYINNLLFKVRNDYYESGNYYVLPAGRHYLVLNGYIEYPADDTVTLPSLNVNTFSTYWNNSTFTSKSGYYPNNEYIILKDLYIAYSQVNGLDDIDNTAEDIADKSSQAHTQEQSYFTQNAQAIEATGLSNYRFNGDQENGIGSVSQDFTLLWNALGGFNSVYIFSLTLSLALMVLRHAPGAIRSSRRNKEE